MPFSEHLHCPFILPALISGTTGMARGPERSPHGVWSCLLSTSSLTTLTRLAATLFCRVFFFFFLLQAFYPGFHLETLLLAWPTPVLGHSFNFTSYKSHSQLTSGGSALCTFSPCIITHHHHLSHTASELLFLWLSGCND